MNINMKTFNTVVYTIIGIALCFAAIKIYSCHSRESGNLVNKPLPGIVTTTKLISGTPDTIKHNVPVSGTSILRRDALHASLINPAELCVLNPADVSAKSDTPKALPSKPEGSRVSYSGTIQDSTFSLGISCAFDTTTGELNLSYEGSVIQKTVSQVDTLFSNTVKTVVEENPWYKTVYAGAAYATTIIITIIYLLVR